MQRWKVCSRRACPSSDVRGALEEGPRVNVSTAPACCHGSGWAVAVGCPAHSWEKCACVYATASSDVRWHWLAWSQTTSEPFEVEAFEVGVGVAPKIRRCANLGAARKRWARRLRWRAACETGLRLLRMLARCALTAALHACTQESHAGQASLSGKVSRARSRPGLQKWGLRANCSEAHAASRPCAMRGESSDSNASKEGVALRSRVTM